MSHESDGNQDRQEVPDLLDGDGHDVEKDKESSSGANKQKEDDEDNTVSSPSCTSAAESPPSTFLRLGFSQTMAMKLVDDQGIDSPQTLASLSDGTLLLFATLIEGLVDKIIYSSA